MQTLQIQLPDSINIETQEIQLFDVLANIIDTMTSRSL